MEIVEALTDPSGVEPWRLGEEELRSAVVELTTHLRAAEALRLRLLADVDRRGAGTATGAASTARWYAGATRTSTGLSANLVELARALTRVPDTAAELDRGAVSVDHAREVVAALDALPEVDDAGETRDACQQALLATAAVDDPLAVRRTGLEMLARAQVDSLEDAEERAVERRELRISRAPVNGMVRLSGLLDTEGAEAVLAALSPLAAPDPAADGTPDPRTSPRRAADALVELASRALGGGRLGTEGCVRPHVTLTVDAERLVHGAAADPSRPLPQLAHLGAVSDAAARRWCCDAEVTPVSLDAELAPLDVGRSTRLVTGGLRRALVARDRGCAFPGCGRPSSWTHAHHVVHWADGGVTALHNLALLCGHHHRAVHHRGWEVTIGEDRHPWFTPPAWVDPRREPRPSHARRDVPAAV
ncbi:HNH endonuclease signature motif containing protein [Rhodococcus aerolatus]